jgi:eukaryotic-like serine/threonine-protein kinase
MNLRPSEPLPTLTIGAVIEGTAYRVVHKLGEGGMGAVYEVVHLPTGERRALKILRRPLFGNPTYEELFMLEILALERLTDAPHIVRIFEQGRTLGRPYYVMEFVEGETLYQRFKHPRRLSLAEVLSVVRQLLMAVRAVHRVGVIHRDIKPENIMIRPNGEVVLLDFGLVKALTENGLGKRLYPTPPLQLRGTAPYLPPELVYDRKPDERGDLYAVGVVLFECLAVGLPYEHVRTDAYHAYVARHGFPSLSEAGVAAPPELERVVRRATLPSPDARYQTAETFAVELLDAVPPAEVNGRPLPAAPPAPPALPAPSAPVPALVAPAPAPVAPRPPRPAAPWWTLPLAFASLTSGVASTLAVLGSMGWMGPPAPTARVVAEPRAPARPEARTGAAAAPPAPEAPRPADVRPPAAPATGTATARPPSASASADKGGDLRAKLEAKLRSNRGTAADARSLASLCRADGDMACVEQAEAMVKRLGSKR